MISIILKFNRITDNYINYKNGHPFAAYLK